MTGSNNRTVYSTEQHIPKKAESESPGNNAAQIAVPAAMQRVYVRLDRKGRGGKSVSLIEGLQLSPIDMEALLRRLKSRLGTGGAVKDAVLEIQGDHRDAIIKFLENLQYRPKRAGG